MKRVAFLALILVPLLLDWAFPFPHQKIRRPPAVIVHDRAGEPLRIFLPQDEKYRFPVTLDEVPPELIQALIASEDRNFYRHPGVDPLAMVRASWANVRARRVVSGASTIPMQIARMTEPRRRSLRAKMIESLRAIQLTAHYSKRQLLEIYVNLAPYGSNIEGVGAASYFYFDKEPRRLSLGEIALLTTLPRSPNRYDPFRDPAAARRARDRVLAQLHERGAFTEREIGEARRQQLPGKRRRVPFAAPHWCELARREAPATTRLETTLDSTMQRIAQQRVAARASALQSRGIGNASVVIIDNKTREVRALVGSADFFDARHDGQNNGAVARRSPGSALKPFLYAKAIDDGRIVPETYLLDIPTDYSGYIAENYDGAYRGRVTTREALVQSLNAPAVRLVADVGVDSFLIMMRRGGLRTLDRAAADYGLPLILGSGEVRLLDLTNLYATLAEGGVHRPLRMFRATAAPARGERLISAEAAAMITEVLCELRRPDMPQGWELTADTPRIAWKTGTSYGHRDAWSVGFSSRYTIGVWIGNFDGHGVKGLSGSEDAAPLLFDLFRAIDPSSVTRRTLSRIEAIDVCAISHQLPTPHCRNRVSIQRIASVSKMSACTTHRLLIVDAQTGERLSGECVASRPSIARVFAIDAPELVSYRRANGEQIATLPPLSAACHDVDTEQRPRIVSPDPATPYRIRRDAPLRYQEIRLAAESGSDVSSLYWYQDGVLIATQRPERAVFVVPAIGQHRIAVVDDLGRSHSVTYEVRN
ncbi:MAG TPA: penicillin-binding protein 1C [Thermoanaerobaculia bacterium]|jgi:penicillin-binding protein 1C|nr:penicillin-binding protein 1C [Thermoanaerobaculia bacterium]